MELLMLIHREDGTKILLWEVTAVIDGVKKRRAVRETWRRWNNVTGSYVPMDSPL